MVCGAVGATESGVRPIPVWYLVAGSDIYEATATPRAEILVKYGYIFTLYSLTVRHFRAVQPATESGAEVILFRFRRCLGKAHYGATATPPADYQQ